MILVVIEKLCIGHCSLIKRYNKAKREHPKESKIMKRGGSQTVASTRKGISESVPSQQERKLVAELRTVRMQAERQLRRHDKVMAKEAEKRSQKA